jgi:hypothetical protein
MKTLLIALQASPTDLARMIERIVNHRRPGLWVDQATVTAWQTRAPEAWRVASAWLAQRKVRVVVISSRPRLEAGMSGALIPDLGPGVPPGPPAAVPARPAA